MISGTKLRRAARRNISTSSKLLAACLTGSVFLAVLFLTWSLSRDTSNTEQSVADRAVVRKDDIAPAATELRSHQDPLRRSDGSSNKNNIRTEIHRDSIADLGFHSQVHHGRLPAAVLGNTVMHGKPRTPCPWKNTAKDEVSASIESLSRTLPPAARQHELSEKLIQHSALQHMMCRRHPSYQAMRSLIFACPQRGCLTLESGLRGILLSYLLAVMTGRSFFVRIDSWMDFHSHLQVPASWKSIDWRISACSWAQMVGETRLKQVLSNARPLNYMRVRDGGCERILQFFRMRPLILGVVTDHDVNCVYRLLGKGGFEMSRLTHESPYSIAFPRIFTFSDAVLNGEYQLQQQHGWEPENSICLHVRTGAFSGQDDTQTGHRNIDDFFRCARMLEHSVGLDKRSDLTWLVISDSDQVSLQAERFLADVCGAGSSHSVINSGCVTRSSPQHYKVADEEGMKRLLLDMRLLSRCKYTVLSKSSFGALAASISSGDTIRSRHHVLVTQQEVNHGKPLSDVCKRVIPDWDGFQYP